MNDGTRLWKRTPRKRRRIQEEIKQERGYKCEECGHTHKLTFHHIKYLWERPDLVFDKDNLIILCRKCHQNKH